jgi:mono/diheme cytochrome c family protein
MRPSVTSYIFAVVAALTVPDICLAEVIPTFEKEVWAIFRAHCFDCHGAGPNPEGKLDLRQVRRMITGGETGPAVVPGQVHESLFLNRIRTGEMPPGEGKVSAAELQTLEHWVAAGAPTRRPEPESIPQGLGIQPEERDFWSFKPILRPVVPDFSDHARVRSPVDAFIFSQLTQAGLDFAPDADWQTLLKRAAFDLTGLPPTDSQRLAVQTSPTAETYAKLVDELLASPQYGERWGRHWLDVAGYADSEGATNDDVVRGSAYHYRDYVINSFNADKPFDQFITEQLAGDELVPRPHSNLNSQQIEQLTATGFLRMAADGTAGGDIDHDIAKNAVVADTLKIVSTSLLGLTVGCAQCHDHRYDPIPQNDYFQLRAVFEPALDWKNWRNPAQREISLYTDADRAQAAAIDAEAEVVRREQQTAQAQFVLAAIQREVEKHPAEQREMLLAAATAPGDKRTPEQIALLTQIPALNINQFNLSQYSQADADKLKEFDGQIAAILAKKAPEHFRRVLTEVPGQVPVTYLFNRGDHRQPRQPVSPGELQITANAGDALAISEQASDLPTTGRRLALARYLTQDNHPLVSRVLVNRVWLNHFGKGLVSTPGDFGKLGVAPTHPELLDWLATEFRETGWSLKRLHRLIMNSTVYRQSSVPSSETLATDPANQLYGRMPVRRLEAETVRDRILAANGTLNLTQFGPPVPVQTDETGQIIVAGEDTRRSLYLQVRRSMPVSFLAMFDAPTMEVNCERRVVSTAATQSLMMLNSDFVLKQARLLAERALREAAASPTRDGSENASIELLWDDPWQYGYGEVTESGMPEVRYTKFPVCANETYAGGVAVPDALLGYTLLNKQGGHPGGTGALAVIRRWVAPADGTLEVRGSVQHFNEDGDGVRARIVVTGQSVQFAVVAHNNVADFPVTHCIVRAGDTVDCVVDCRAAETADTFANRLEYRLVSPSGQLLGYWNSIADFRAPMTVSPVVAIRRAWELALCRLATDDEVASAVQFLRSQAQTIRTTPEFASLGGQTDMQKQLLTNLCQVLMSSNEFLYVD